MNTLWIRYDSLYIAKTTNTLRYDLNSPLLGLIPPYAPVYPMGTSEVPARERGREVFNTSSSITLSLPIAIPRLTIVLHYSPVPLLLVLVPLRGYSENMKTWPQGNLLRSKPLAWAEGRQIAGHPTPNLRREGKFMSSIQNMQKIT